MPFPLVISMYKPNFCAECGTRLLRLRWHVWTSRKFCNDCGRTFRKQRLVTALLTIAFLVAGGFVIGRSGRAPAPPLTVIRRADSPLTAPEDAKSPSARTHVVAAPSVEEEIYICGAETLKGTPCSRRVHGPVRCWQHKGKRAMLPQEKLSVKEQTIRE